MSCLLYLLRLPAQEGGLAIYATSGPCCFAFAPAWWRKFLTSQSPLPFLLSKASHFSQLVRSFQHHPCPDKACPPAAER